ncbi:hypothetical protein PAMC26510_22205 [Caballeronia sordidicola]|uniref:Uncharacterized protein n=2 Tax=Burkholderiales TaxID=80840 RepID=A0A242MLG2_CABSO|nr:hypothetical protein PAMC26510_22205 [Caballeronia sordidicola]
MLVQRINTLTPTTRRLLLVPVDGSSLLAIENYQDVFAFFVLMFRPPGLLGEPVADRA